MDNKNTYDGYVSYVVMESILARTERNFKRMWILILVLIMALIGTNLGWVYYESQFSVTDETTIEQSLTSDGDLTENGDINVK